MSDYLSKVYNNKKAAAVGLSDWRLSNIQSILKNWAGLYLNGLKHSGSGAKGTAIHGVSDVDIFISLKSTTPESLKELYNKLEKYVNNQGITTRRQNVSLGINQYGLNIDLVPGKQQSGYQNYHSIYSSKKDTWMQTNTDLHISTVANSKRLEEIVLTKVWRQNHGLDFPSIYLELSVLEAVKYKSYGNLEANFITVLNYLKDNLVGNTIVDPANSNNKISDSLYQYEKQIIADKAAEAIKAQFWSSVVW